MEVALNITLKTAAEIKGLQEKSGADSIPDLFVRALALFDLATEHRIEGGSIIFRHKDGTEETITL